MTRIRTPSARPGLILIALLVVAIACNIPSPTPTPTPLPPLPPIIIDHTPERGQELAIKAPIAFSFDQAMDHPSVEAAFTISPPIAGSFSWQDNTLLFTPGKPGLARATTYRVTVSSEARSTAGLQLGDSFAFQFKTTGYLEIASVQPAPDTEDVATDATVMVMFNRPVVPLNASQADLPQPLAFEPAIAGQGKWVNTSIYTFKAAPRFLPGTAYKATVVADRLAETTDTVLAEDYAWEFATQRPKVLQTTTSDPESYIGPSPTISITFNMPMDHASAEEHFTLLPEKGMQPLPGQFQWDGETMGFKPAVPLSLGTQYLATVVAGARASTGGEGMEDDFHWSFRTIEAPRVLFSSPADGEQDVHPYTSLLVAFSSPMDPDTLLPNLTILPQPTEVYTSWLRSDTQVYISFGAKPSTTYTFEFAANMKGRYGHRLVEPYQITFATRALSPSINLPPDRVGTYNAYTTTAAYVQHVNVSELDLALYRLDRADFVQLMERDWWQRWEKFHPPAKNLVRKWTSSVEATLNQHLATVVPLAEDGTSPLQAGFYYLEVRAPKVKELARHMLLVSRANVTLKVTADEALVWVTDLSSGHGIASLDVVIFGEDSRVLASGRTDAHGIFFSELAPQLEADPWASILAIAGPDQDPAVASSNWADGIALWQFDLPSEPYRERYHTYLYTDRNIYRPGQTVYFKGILRGDDDANYSLPAGVESMQVVIHDEQGKEIYRADSPLNDIGTLHGEIKLADDASLGSYYLSAQLEERTFGTSFRVAEYRKPEFVVTVETDTDEYVQGDEVAAQVTASYYFGGPVADAKVQWRLMSQDYFFPWTGKGYYDFHDLNYNSRGKQTSHGELVTSGQGTLDAEGTFSFVLSADIAAKKNSQIFTLEASITDPSNQEVSRRHSVIVHKGHFYIGLEPQEYIGTVNHESKVNVITVDPESAPVPNVPLTIVFFESRWYNVQQQADDGRFYWQWELEETPVHTTTVTTDETGIAIAVFTPEKGGSYRVRAIGRDHKENEIRSSTYLWISSRSFVSWRQENHDRIELVTDKKSYRPGETARVLVPSPFQGPVQALLTVERGHIYEHQVLTLRTNSDQIEIPILSQYAPNAYISVVIVRGLDRDNPVPSYRVGYVTIEVSTEEKELTVQLSPDKATAYLPGAKATFSLHATDYQGRGVEAELSLQLVDLSVLALTNGGQGTLLDHFYRQRGLGVRTGATLSISVDRFRLQAQPPAAKGGDGGPAGRDVIRKRFLDTAYWNAEVRTDAKGQAQVTVDLPDNLTTWRATAKAITVDTLVGDGNADIVTSKDLLIRPIAPRFFVLGDQVQLGAVVHNNTAQALTIDVSLEGHGITIADGVQRGEVPAQGMQALNWQTQVISAPAAVLTWHAASGDLFDALELSLPVYHYSTPEVIATAGQVAGGEARIETVRLPKLLDPGQGDLTVQLDPSLAAGMRDGLRYLENYPYHCIEQTVSRFLPNVITYRALKQLGIINPELEARLPQYVSIGLQRIYALQHYDGGWGWWLADESNPFISAYVLLGMTAAKDAGFAVDDKVMDRAASYLQDILDLAHTQRTYYNNTHAFILYVLAEYGEGDLGRSIALYERRDSLDLYAKAYLLMALRTLEPQERTHANALLSDLTSAAILSATGAHWEEDEVDYWTMNTNTRTTAVVLEALLRTDPQNSLLPNVVRWLMTARKEGHWETTQETAWSIMALTDFMVTTGELQAHYDYRVTVNGQALGQGTVTTQDVNQTRKLVIAIQDLLHHETNRIVLERLAPQTQDTGQGTPSAGPGGKGQLYYSLYLRYYLPVEDVVALDRGIIVSRQYALLDDPEQSIDSATVGDVIRVKLTIIAPNDLHYLVVEDPLPAGCEALDTSLKTTSAAYQGPELTRQDGRPPYWWYFTQTELRDEKVALFATYLGKGTYEYSYLIRASVPGRFLTMPSHAYEMYFPEVFGRSDGGVFTVSE